MKKNSLELDFGSWKSFKVNDIFKCETTKSLIYTEKGIHPYITRSAINNGLTDYVDINNGNYELNKKIV